MSDWSWILVIAWTCWDPYHKLKLFQCHMLQKQLKLISSFPLLFMKLKHFQSFLLSTKRFCLNFIHVIRLMDFFLELLGNKRKCFTYHYFCLWCWRCWKSSSKGWSIHSNIDTVTIFYFDDPFTEQKNRLNDLEAKYGGREPKSKIIPWMSIKTDIPSQVKSKFYHGIHP